MLAALLFAVTIVAHEPGYMTSLAKHLQRWLGNEKITAQVVTPASMASALANENLAFLVGFSSPTPTEMSCLRDFRARGGKLVVFYSSSSALAGLMGVKPLGFKTAAYPGQWSRMVFNSKNPEGLPTSILQTSSVLQRAIPINGRGRIIATWVDRNGKSTGDAAWIATDAGFWMTHVLLADGEEDQKSRLLGAIVGSVYPSKWNYAAYCARVNADDACTRAYAAQQVACSGEIHAVWEHSGFGLYPGNWPQTIQLLKAAHVTDLFVNVGGAGFAFYPSAVLPRQKEDEGDQLAACLKAAAGSGIRVHAWIVCFGTMRATKDRTEVFKRRGWLVKSERGEDLPFLNPALPAVRQYMVSAIDELQRNYPALAGIHLDYVRWHDNAMKPKDSVQPISRFVAEARRVVKRPKWLTTAVYGGYPDCVVNVGQDWVSWLDMSIVDYVVPMDYTESNATFEKLLKQHSSLKIRARKTIVGIGVTANESRLNAKQVIDQIKLSRRYGMAGQAVFDLDTTFEKQIYPYLKLGIW